MSSVEAARWYSGLVKADPRCTIPRVSWSSLTTTYIMLEVAWHKPQSDLQVSSIFPGFGVAWERLAMRMAAASAGLGAA